MTAVLAIVLATSLLLTYETLTRSAEQAIRQRLVPAAEQIASSIELPIAERAVTMRRLAADSAIRRAAKVALASRGDDTAAVMAAARAALDRARTGVDSMRPMELWSADGRRLTWVGTSPPLGNWAPDAADGTGFPVRRQGLEKVVASDDVVFGRLFGSGARTYFWTAAPVIDDGKHIAYVAWQRAVTGPPRATQMLRDLTGENVAMFMRNDDNTFWADGSGTAEAPSSIVRASKHGLLHFRDGIGAIAAVEAPVARTPWIVVLEDPFSSIYAPPREAVLSLSLLSVILIAAGALISWGISRRITAPLAVLSNAAEAIAAGDYRRRVERDGDDEIGRVAASFNQMASEVEASRRSLELQVEEAQSVAEELELANEQLQEAMVGAEDAQREAEQAREEAERANRAKSDFLAVMSHELRTPLNAIGGYAQLMEMEIHGPITDAQRDALARIARSQSHLLGLINDVLNFARIDAGQVHYAIADVPLDEALGGLESLIAPQIRAKRLRFTYHRCATHVTVRADRDKLLQVALNLLTNAIKFTSDGGSVDVECIDETDSVRIQVRDTGMGIPLERQRAIFDPFVQVDRALHRPNDGVGLGLAISRDLARGMGGDLAVASTVGVGSVFTLTLARHERFPLLEENAAGIAAPARAKGAERKDTSALPIGSRHAGPGLTLT